MEIQNLEIYPKIKIRENAKYIYKIFIKHVNNYKNTSFISSMK
jgi:hypothetical protein